MIILCANKVFCDSGTYDGYYRFTFKVVQNGEGTFYAYDKANRYTVGAFYGIR
jgi:hypothetical protein